MKTLGVKFDLIRVFEYGDNKVEIGQDLSLHEVTFSNGISMILKEYHESI